MVVCSVAEVVRVLEWKVVVAAVAIRGGRERSIIHRLSVVGLLMVGVSLMVCHASLLVRLRMVLVDASGRQTTRVKRVGDHLMRRILLHRLL